MNTFWRNMTHQRFNLIIILDILQLKAISCVLLISYDKFESLTFTLVFTIWFSTLARNYKANIDPHSKFFLFKWRLFSRSIYIFYHYVVTYLNIFLFRSQFEFNIWVLAWIIARCIFQLSESIERAYYHSLWLLRHIKVFSDLHYF